MIKCPNCHGSYYRENYTIGTLLYFPPVYKDGININPDGNTYKTHCTCLDCKNRFSYSMKYGKIIDIVDKGPAIDKNTILTVDENGNFI